MLDTALLATALIALLELGSGQLGAAGFEVLAPPKGTLPAGCELSPPPGGMRPPLDANPAISSDPLWLGLESIWHFGMTEEAELAELRAARRPSLPGDEEKAIFLERGSAFEAGYLASYGEVPNHVYVRALRFKDDLAPAQREAFAFPAAPPFLRPGDVRIELGDLVVLVASNLGPDVPCLEPLKKFFESIEPRRPVGR